MTLALVTFASLVVAVVMSVVAWRLARENRVRSEARVAALAIALDRDEGADAPLERPGDHDLFAAARHGAGSGRRIGPALVLAGLAAAAIVGTMLLAGRAGDASSSRSSALRPLELLSLRHVQLEGATTITGLVRNPRGAVVLERATVVVYFFDGSGAFLSSARGPLEFPRLAAGEESPFRVSVPTPEGVSRYRVSFRLAEGGIVPHVDRREN